MDCGSFCRRALTETLRPTAQPKRIDYYYIASLALAQVILFPYRLHQNLEGLHLPLRQQPELGAEKHKVLEARVQVRRHLQCLERPEEAAIYDPVNPEEPPEYLPAKCSELRRLEHPQSLGLIVVVGKFGLVIDLVGYPLQNLLDVDRGGDRDGRGVAAGSLGPAVLDPRGKALPGAEGVQVRVLRHDGPYCRDVIVEIDGICPVVR